MKTIEQIALELAHHTCTRYAHMDSVRYSFTDQNMIDYAVKVVEAWQAQQSQEAVAVVQNCSIEGQRASIMSDSLSAGDYLYAAPPMPKIKQEPVAYMVPSGTCVTAEDVGYTPNWTDYYTIPLYTEPQEDYFADACRLAMELECLLLDCKDTAVTAKWWDSANEALDQHRERIEQMRKDKE